MRWAEIFLGIVSLFFVVILLFYWFFPMGKVEFGMEKNGNFSVEGKTSKMQFYENMRFRDRNISYHIDENCTLKKKADMKNSFGILSSKTNLEFYPVESFEDIMISCQNKNKVEGGLFIAGEGGPTNVSSGENFQVISHGKILLIRDSDCPNPNVAIHELLHVLGFDHSENEKNIMYPVSFCGQTIGQEILDKINDLYSYDSLPDLKFEEANFVLNGRYIDVNFSIRNDGLKDASPSEVFIYVDGREIKSVDIEEMKLGYGVKINLRNIFTSKFKIEEVKFEIKTNGPELSKENNIIYLNQTV